LDILDQVGKYVNENAEAIFGTKTLVNPYPYDIDWAEFTRKPYTIFIHILKGQKNNIYLPNIGNKVEKALLLGNRESLQFQCSRDCEGNSSVNIELPQTLRNKACFCIALHTAEEEPLFENIK
jgi:alpha-L-fucosidase